MKVSVYTLQFMFIKIKWETREGRRWGGESGHTRHTHACAVRNAKNLCIKLVPFGMRGEERGTDDKLCGDENEQIAHGVCKIDCC